MSIATYAELKTAVLAWMARTELTSEVDDFLDLAEADINTRLRCREMETVVSLTPTANVCTLPSGYLEYKRVIEVASIRRPLQYITEDAADLSYPTRAAGLADHFMIVGASLTALPVSSNNIELTYYLAVPALSGSATTNWLLTKMPNLYLHACLHQGALFIKDYGEAERQLGLMERCIGLLNGLDNRAKFGNAGMMLSGLTP